MENENGYVFLKYVATLIAIISIVFIVVCGINYFMVSNLQAKICLATPDIQKNIYPFPCDLGRNRNNNN